MMKQATVLHKIENNELTAAEGYDLLYPFKKQKIGKRASFVKLKVRVLNEGRGVNNLLRVLFILPIPILFARIILRFSTRFIKSDDVDLKKMVHLIKYSKNTRVSVESDDAIINIEVI